MHVKRVKLMFKGNPVEKQPKEVRIPIGNTSKRALFGKHSDHVVKSILASSQKTIVTNSNQPKDMTPFEWSLQYQEKGSRLILMLSKVAGEGVIEAGNIFAYGKLLSVYYEAANSNLLIIKCEISCYQKIN
jgi:hypothetical protein